MPLSDPISFASVKWTSIPNEPGVYVIADQQEIVYVGMAGRNGKGGIRNRLRDHASGQIVNMFAQYLFLARVQFLGEKRITHPRDAKCSDLITSECRLDYIADFDWNYLRICARSCCHYLRID